MRLRNLFGWAPFREAADKLGDRMAIAMSALSYPVQVPKGDSTVGDAHFASKPEVDFVDPFSGSEWDLLIGSHPESTFFHCSAWARVLSKTYGHKPFYLHLCRDGVSLALIPLMEIRSSFTGSRGLCLPFSDFCGPLAFGRPERRLLVDPLRALAKERKWDYFEIRDQSALPSASTSSVQYYNHSLDLRPRPETLFANCFSSVRRAVRKAEKSGLTAKISQSWSSLRAFYRLHVRTRRRHGLPPQPLSFFRNIFTEVIEPGLGFIVRADLGSRCLAAAVFFQFGRKALFKFGASDPAWQQLRGNNLVMWEGICFLAESHCELLDFGRTSLANTSLRRFKLGWGVKEEIIGYSKWDTSAGAWVESCDHASGRHNAIFSRMPLALNRWAGALCYPHLD